MPVSIIMNREKKYTIDELKKENESLHRKVRELEKKNSELQYELYDALDRLTCVLDTHPQAVDTLIDHGFPMDGEEE